MIRSGPGLINVLESLSLSPVALFYSVRFPFIDGRAEVTEATFADTRRGDDGREFKDGFVLIARTMGLFVVWAN